MAGDYREWYNLRSNTNTRNQEPSRLQKDPPLLSNASRYLAAQYAGPANPPRYAAPVNSRQYTGPANPAPYTASVNSSQYIVPANPIPYTVPVNSRQYSVPANPTPYTVPVDSRQYIVPANSIPYTVPVNSRQYSVPANPTPYTPPVDSRQYVVSTNPAPYVGSGYPGQFSVPIPPQQYARHSYFAQSDGYGNTTDQVLADLMGTVSIDQRPSIQDYRSALVATPPRQDAINEVVQEVLNQDLRTLRNEKLLSSNLVFDLARQFARRWDISDEAVNSHIMLACGYFKFPVILLLNPAPTHEVLPFDQMVNGCKTLRWIEDVLHSIGLALGDVIILDACTLLGNDRLKQLGRKGKRIKEQAMAEAYNLTQEMLRLIQPNIILSCQCSTSFPDWNAKGHVIARQLCSSIQSAKYREVKKVYLNDQTINVIQAYHPSGFLNNKGDRMAHHDTFGYFLKSVFQTVYRPCANWKSQHLMNTLVLPNTSIYV